MVEVETPFGNIKTKHVVNCTGVWANYIADMVSFMFKDRARGSCNIPNLLTFSKVKFFGPLVHPPNQESTYSEGSPTQEKTGNNKRKILLPVSRSYSFIAFLLCWRFEKAKKKYFTYTKIDEIINKVFFYFLPGWIKNSFVSYETCLHNNRSDSWYR